MHAFRDDLRLAARNLLRSPGFSLVVILTLALGIGSVTAVYTLIDGVVLRPLPFEDPDSLVNLFGYDLDSGAGTWWASYPDLADFRDRSKSFAILAGARSYPANVAGHQDRPDRLTVGRVTHDLFDLLGTRVVHGREFVPEDDKRGAEPVALISVGFWRQHYGGADAGEGRQAGRSVLGRVLTINAIPHTIVGVIENPHLPPGADAEVFTPYVMEA